MPKKPKSLAKIRKLNYIKDNAVEDKVIKKLEKQLKLNKRKSKTVPKSFISDGLDYLLEICDEDGRQMVAETEKRLQLGSDFDSDSENNEKATIKEIQKSKTKKHQKLSQSEPTEKIKQKKRKISCDDISESEDYSSSSECDSNFDKKDNQSKKLDLKKNSTKSNKKKNSIPVKQDENDDSDSNESLVDDEEGHFSDKNEEHDDIPDKNDENEDIEVWEDIYGRKRDKDGNVISETCGKYVPPGARLKNLEETSAKSESFLRLRRQMKGLLNRLAENNMHTVLSQLDELYMSNSRNDMNEMLSLLMAESLVSPVITPDRLVSEHMMCVSILHANIGTEVGAHFALHLVKKFNQMLKEKQDVENKELDNVVLMISHLYNFKVFSSQLMYELLNKLTAQFTEKEIELILVILRTVGFSLRKDDPIALKELIVTLQQKAATTQSTNSRVQFMLDILLAIKNNNMNKIPQYDPSHIEHLKKLLKTLIRKGNSISQLNLTLEDLLNADERGKWWIVGSAWAGNVIPNNSSKTDKNEKPLYSKKILDLARAQRMNTDTRRNIFCILMTAEDYLDAFEKLHHLGLKDRQEREIIYVILNCCLQEKKFNPYYPILAQKFCDCDRKYQMMIQYTLWDKFKILSNYNSIQLTNLAKFISYLIIQKGLPLSVLKVIELGELDNYTMRLLRTIMLEILLHENAELCLTVFERIAHSAKLQHFREGIRLFISHFLMKNKKLNTLSVKQMTLLKRRADLADKILTTSSSKVTF